MQLWGQRRTSSDEQLLSSVKSNLDYHTSFDLARQYRDQVIPLRKKVSDEALLRYNGMLISVFELLADSREQAAAINTTRQDTSVERHSGALASPAEIRSLAPLCS